MCFTPYKHLNTTTTTYIVMRRVTCQSCSYGWDSITKLETVTCPNCGKKTPVVGEKEDDTGTQANN